MSAVSVLIGLLLVVHVACAALNVRFAREMRRLHDDALGCLRRAEAAERRMLALRLGGPMSPDRVRRADDDVIAIYRTRTDAS